MRGECVIEISNFFCHVISSSAFSIYSKNKISIHADIHVWNSMKPKTCWTSDEILIWYSVPQPIDLKWILLFLQRRPSWILNVCESSGGKDSFSIFIYPSGWCIQSSLLRKINSINWAGRMRVECWWRENNDLQTFEQPTYNGGEYDREGQRILREANEISTNFLYERVESVDET